MKSFSHQNLQQEFSLATGQNSRQNSKLQALTAYRNHKNSMLSIHQSHTTHQHQICLPSIQQKGQWMSWGLSLVSVTKQPTSFVAASKHSAVKPQHNNYLRISVFSSRQRPQFSVVLDIHKKKFLLKQKRTDFLRSQESSNSRQSSQNPSQSSIESFSFAS